MISVVVPVYNIEKYIVECLKSIVNQSYRDFELILVDDGSADNSIELAEEYLKDKNINYKVYHKENGGLGSARNYGIRKAEGEYVVCIDGDDIVSHDFLERLLNNIEGCDFSFCDFQFIRQYQMKEDSNNEIKEFDKDELLDIFSKRTIGFVVPSMLFRRDFLIDNNLFFNEEIRFSEDQMFIWKVLFKTNKARYLYRKMYGYYVRETSIMNSSSYDKIEKAYYLYEDLIDELNRDYPDYHELIRYILPRWKLGALYTSARILSKDNFNQLCRIMDSKKIFDDIKGIGEIKAYLLAFVSRISDNVLYRLCRMMNLNG